MGKRKGKSNHRKKGGFSGNDAGGNRNKKEKEMAKKEYYCNKRATSFGPDPSEDDQLARQLEALGGLCVKEVEGDSNCCFRSLSDQLYGFPSKHHEVRSDVVDFMEQNKEDFIPFVEDDESWENYIMRMRKNSQWGGHQELVAASRCYECSIVLHQPGKPILEIRNGNRNLHLAYYGELHYNSVRLSGNCIGPPKSIALMETAAPTTSFPYPLPASNSKHKSIERLRTAKDEVFQSCPWAKNESINTAIHFANGDAVGAIEILIEGKEKKCSEEQ